MISLKCMELRLVSKMRTDLNSQMVSVLKRTAVIRITKYFPKRSNQSESKIICFDEYGCFIKAYDFKYHSRGSLKSFLPKRITVIEDGYYLSKKNFNYYEVTS